MESDGDNEELIETERLSERLGLRERLKLTLWLGERDEEREMLELGD